MPSNLYRILTYFCVKSLPMGAELFIYDNFVALSFEEAYQMLKNQVWKDPKEERAPDDPKVPQETLFASRIVCYDMEGDGQPAQSWCFDQRNAFYSGTCPTPMPVPKATEESWEWTVGMVVGLYHKRNLMFGIIREIIGPSGSRAFPLFAVDLAYTDSDGALKRVVCDASNFLPYPHSVVEEWNKNYFDEMNVDDELMEKIISRTRIVEEYPYPLSHEAPLIAPKPDEDFLSYFYETSRIEALGEIADGVEKNEISLGFFATPEQARAAMMRDVSTRKDGDPPIFYYGITMWGRSQKIEYWGNFNWVGHWCFDETGRLKGWSDMSSRPFLGKDPDECHFKIGDIVAFFDMDGIYRPGVVRTVPFGKEKAAKIGLDMSDDCYSVESAVFPESSHIPHDHLAEPRLLIFKGHLKDSTRRRFASYLINDEERASLRAKLKFPPSIVWNRESSQEAKCTDIGYERART